jgi:hypothetical protein
MTSRAAYATCLDLASKQTNRSKAALFVVWVMCGLLLPEAHDRVSQLKTSTGPFPTQ